MKRIKQASKISQNERIKDIIPQIRKYTAEQVGGSEVIRCLRDSLIDGRLQWKKKKVPYRHQKILKERERKENIERRENLREQGIIKPKKNRRKNRSLKK